MTNAKKPRIAAVLDWAVAIVALLVGAAFVVIEWPNPSWISWTFFVIGVIGVPLAMFNPVERVKTFLLRRLVKKNR